MLTLAVIFFVYGDVINDRFFSIFENLNTTFRGTQREYSSEPLKHRIVERILVFKR